jgi:pimeloyl-ACP methyl ester carboxylesterase
LWRHPYFGEAFFNALASPPSLRYFLAQQAYYDTSLITDDVIGAYFATTHQPGARYAPGSFISGLLNLPIRREWLSLKQPTLLVWGRQATSTPVQDADAFLALKPDTRLEVIDHARLLPHDEHADKFNQLALEFLSQK